MKTPEKYRLPYNPCNPFSSRPGDPYGMFHIPLNKNTVLWVRATAAMDHIPWDHVSVSVHHVKGHDLDRCPTWEEMCMVKDLFWDPEETVIQFHPPESVYISQHNYCLHLWRPTHVDIPLPPPELVGLKPKKT